MEPSPLTEELVYDLWTKTYNNNGRPDWSHLFPYYHEDITFQDTIQEVKGIVAFKQMCARLTKRSQRLSMELTHVTKTENTIMLEWIMTLSFRKSPDTPLFGCTKLTLHEDGRIVSQRDYYDLWGDIFNGIPYFKKTYRRTLKRFFG